MPQGQWDDARRAFERAVRFNPGLALAHYNLGGRARHAGAARGGHSRVSRDRATGARDERSVRQHRRRAVQARSSTPKRSPTWNRPSASHRNPPPRITISGSSSQAWVAWTTLSTRSSVRRRWRRTDARTRRALADTHYNVGVTHARARRWSDAIDSYHKAIGFNRELPEAFNGAGIALSRLHRDQSAVAMFDEALRLRPSFAEARYNLASSLAALGRYGDAIESCRAALRTRPHLRQAIQLLDGRSAHVRAGPPLGRKHDASGTQYDERRTLNAEPRERGTERTQRTERQAERQPGNGTMEPNRTSRT